MLAPAAIEAVKQWKYKPYFLNGEPVEVETQITVNFTCLAVRTPKCARQLWRLHSPSHLVANGTGC